MENKKWFAYQVNDEDNDWGTGSYDFDEVKEWLRENVDGRIAVIDDGDDPICVEEIYWEDVFAEEIAEAARINREYYVYNELEWYGSERPVCVDRAEAERLMADSESADQFDEYFHEASAREIVAYGTYDSEPKYTTANTDFLPEQIRAKYIESARGYDSVDLFIAEAGWDPAWMCDFTAAADGDEITDAESAVIDDILRQLWEAAHED